ncbi:hypothetical protein F4820DRAFT_152784 [Hypoxylon rubiginosum]|uniref:Uncharacterized protein n=1 Tax=Hypoxylon rubiginosum TaxID=110542 RepID=A0ACB9ZAP9_9PEZI|nr:hypothetical protein F4820DRAFT_152784 [Hypoxylon rubiginosum]
MSSHTWFLYELVGGLGLTRLLYTSRHDELCCKLPSLPYPCISSAYLLHLARVSVPFWQSSTPHLHLHTCWLSLWATSINRDAQCCLGIFVCLSLLLIDEFLADCRPRSPPPWEHMIRRSKRATPYV